MGPSNLLASAAMLGSTAAKQAMASCHSQRAWAVPATTQSRMMHGRTSVLAVLPLPRHSKSAAADLAASHRALNAFVLLIEGARTYASGISMGAVAGFVRFSVASPAAPRRSAVPAPPRRPRLREDSPIRIHLPLENVARLYIYCFFRVNG